MLKKILLGGVIAVAAVIGSAGPGHAQVSVDLGLHFGSPPQFEQVPASPVEYAPAVGANLFSYDGQYFVFLGTTWYVGPGHNGPWTELPPQYVPRPILAVPVNYYHSRPREWAYWRHDAPPRWGPAWGTRWEEHRHGDYYRHGYADDRRPVRPSVYRNDHRDDRYADRHVAYRDDHRDDRRGGGSGGDHRDDRHSSYRDDRR
jgi:hypothetical protein